MANKNLILNGPRVVPGDVSANGRRFENGVGNLHLRYTVTKEDLVALGAFLTGDVKLFELPVGAVINRTTVKPRVAATGTTTLVGYVTADTSGHNYGNTSFDLKAAVSDTNFDIDDESQKEGAGGWVMAHFIATVENLSAVTAGEVDFEVDYYVIA